MSKKLVEFPLFLTEDANIVEIRKLYDREQPCQFNCSNCGKLVNQHLRNITFVCKDCKTKSFCIKKYGVDNPSKDSQIIQIIKEKNKASDPETRRKYRETCIKKYGVDNAFIGIKVLRKNDVRPYLNYVKDVYGPDYLSYFRNV